MGHPVQLRVDDSFDDDLKIKEVATLASLNSSGSRIE
jgi:hypothetical protein